MEIKTEFLKCQCTLLAIIFLAIPFAAHAAAGKIEFASSGATVVDANGQSKILLKGMDINQGDTILTGTGRAQARFTDGSYLSFQPNTEFKVEEYNFNGKQDGTEKGFFKLVKGGLRAISGLVGREHRPAYRLATPVATIGIRGSYYLAEFNEKLKAHVGQGSIYIFNEQGNIILFAGQGAEVKPGEAPQYSNEEMTLGARGPVPAQPAQVQEQQFAETANQSTFRVAEQYDDDGLVCSTGNCGISSVIANLNGMDAMGYYNLDEKAANVGGGSGWVTKVDNGSQLYIDFGSYDVSAYVNISAARPDGQTAYDSFSLTGNVLKNGSFAATGTNQSNNSFQALAISTDSGSLCDSTCKMSLGGYLTGSQADRAITGYAIEGVNNGEGGTGQVTGKAEFIVNQNREVIIDNGQLDCISCVQ